MQAIKQYVCAFIPHKNKHRSLFNPVLTMINSEIFLAIDDLYRPPKDLSIYSQRRVPHSSATLGFWESNEKQTKE